MDTDRKSLFERINRKLSVLEEMLDCEDCIYVLEVRESVSKLIDTYEDELKEFDEDYIHIDTVADYVNDYPTFMDYP